MGASASMSENLQPIGLGFALLRARHEWLRHDCAADKYDKFPSPHGFARAAAHSCGHSHGVSAEAHGPRAEAHAMSAKAHEMSAEAHGPRAEAHGMSAEAHGMSAKAHGPKTKSAC